MTTEHPTVLVVGPFSESAGGVVTFQRNLIFHSKLHDRWSFRQFNISRTPHSVARKVIHEHQTFSFMRSGLRHTLRMGGEVLRNVLRFPLQLGDVDVVQLQSSDHYAFWEACVYLRLAKLRGVPVSMRFGGVFNSFYEGSSKATQKRIRHMLTLPDTIVVQSEEWKRYFATITDVNKLHIMPNAVPPPPPIPQRELRPKRVRALFIATSEAKRKGVETVLNAAPGLRAQVQFVFVAASEGLKQQVKDLGLEDCIELHDSVSREEMKSRFYPQADVLLLPSHKEGFPNTMLEAMAAGLPLITSPAGAIPEVLTATVHAFINPADDAEGLERDLRHLCENPEQRQAMGQRCHQLIKERYVIDRAFDHFDHIWRTAIRNAG